MSADRLGLVVCGLCLGTGALAAEEPPPSPESRIPLGDALGELEPRDLFQNSYYSTQIPRFAGIATQDLKDGQH